jgi:FXSXX-COOH protein
MDTPETIPSVIPDVRTVPLARLAAAQRTVPASVLAAAPGARLPVAAFTSSI